MASRAWRCSAFIGFLRCLFEELASYLRIAQLLNGLRNIGDSRSG